MESRFTFTRQEVGQSIINLKIQISRLEDRLQCEQLKLDMLHLERQGEVMPLDDKIFA